MKTTVVLGASLKEERYAHVAIRKLRQYHHDVVAIGRQKGTVADVEVITHTPSLDTVDTVTLYLNPIHQRSYYEYIKALVPRRVIFNPGTENPELYTILEEAEISYEIACTLVLLSTNQY